VRRLEITLGTAAIQRWVKKDGFWNAPTANFVPDNGLMPYELQKLDLHQVA